MRNLPIILVTVAVALNASLCRAAEPLHMVTAAQPPLGPSAQTPGFLGSVAREAFRRIGLDIEVSMLPGERAMINVNTGVDDGELMRNPDIERLYPELLRVPEPIYTIEIMGFALEPKPDVQTFADLARYEVAFVAGRKTIEDDVKSAKQITVVRNLEDLFQLLKSRRTEIVLAERWQAMAHVKKLDLSVIALEPPLRKTEMFVYLNKRHSDIVTKLAQSLAALKADGTYRKLQLQYLAKPD